MSCKSETIKTELPIPYPLYQSEQGRYFIGQTPQLNANSSTALIALVNPRCSYVNLYINAITVTNLLQDNFSAEFYIHSNQTLNTTSYLISCTNLSIVPTPHNKGIIQYQSGYDLQIYNGVPIFTRIIPQTSTLVIDGGQIIIPPGQSLLVLLNDISPVSSSLNNKSFIVAFGWWEEQVCANYKL